MSRGIKEGDRMVKNPKKEETILLSTENIDLKIFETEVNLDKASQSELKPFWNEECEKLSRYIGVPGKPTDKKLETYTYNILGEQTEHPEKGVKTLSCRLYPSKNKDPVTGKSEHEKLQEDISIFRWFCNFTRDVLMFSYKKFQKDKSEINEKVYKHLFPKEKTKQEIIDQQTKENKKLNEEHEIKVRLAKRGTTAEVRKANKKEITALKKKHYQELKEFDKRIKQVKKSEEYKALLTTLQAEDLFCKFTSGGKGNQLSLFSIRRLMQYITIVGETVNAFDQRVNIIEYDPSRTEGYYKPSWMENIKVNNRIIRGAIKITVAAFKAAMTNLYKGNISHFDFSRHLSRKNFNLIHFEDDHVPPYIKNMKIRGKKGEKVDWSKGCTIKYNKNKKSYILYHFTRFEPKPLKKQPGVMNMKQDVITAIDPGIINAETCYTFDGEGKESYVDEHSFLKEIPNIKKILVRSDALKSQLAKFKEAKQHTPRRIVEGVTRKKLRLNQKIDSRLAEQNDHILLPDFRVSEVAKKTELKSEYKRILYLNQFFGFKQFLEYKCNVTGTNLYI